MTSPLRIAALSLALVLPLASAEARDARTRGMTAQDRAARDTAQRFSARLGRLDALMGGVPRSAATAPRARSADAEH